MHRRSIRVDIVSQAEHPTRRHGFAAELDSPSIVLNRYRSAYCAQSQLRMKKRRKKPQEAAERFRDEAAYLCGECGEEIVVPVDVSAGTSQRYVEDCPVCCHPNVIQVEIDEDGSSRVWSEPE
jgi:hypothetical protein